MVQSDNATEPYKMDRRVHQDVPAETRVHGVDAGLRGPGVPGVRSHRRLRKSGTESVIVNLV